MKMTQSSLFQIMKEIKFWDLMLEGNQILGFQLERESQNT